MVVIDLIGPPSCDNRSTRNLSLQRYTLMLERHRIVEVERKRSLILITTQVIKCVSLEGEIVSTTMVTGEGTNLIDHHHHISVMFENY